MEIIAKEFYRIEIPNTDALVLCQILDRVVAGEDASSYGDEARTIVNGLRLQLEARTDNDESIV